MGFSAWPDPARTWEAMPPAPPQADRGKANNGLWRVAATMDAWTGRVLYLDNYIIGRKKLTELYRRIAEVYPRAKEIYVVQDNWSIHSHPDVLESLRQHPTIKSIWLPTYAPWLNPSKNCGDGSKKRFSNCIAWPAMHPHCWNAFAAFSTSFRNDPKASSTTWACSAMAN